VIFSLRRANIYIDSAMDRVLEATLRTIEALEYQIGSHHLRIKRQTARVEELEREKQALVAEHAKTVLKRMEVVLALAESDLREAEARRDHRLGKEKPHN
jgi:hypothetical protein